MNVLFGWVTTRATTTRFKIPYPPFRLIHGLRIERSEASDR